MEKYARIINEETKECEVGLGTNETVYLSQGMELQEVEQSDINFKWYIAGFAPMKSGREKELEIAQAEIERLEAMQTPRLYREAIAGGEYATNKLAEIDELIAELRAIINTPVEEEKLSAETNAKVAEIKARYPYPVE